MEPTDFEKAFSDFIDRREYDEAENALFSMVRIAFLAGWNAAGGRPPKPQKVIALFHKEDIAPNAIETDLHPTGAPRQEELIQRLNACSPKDRETALRLLNVYLQSLP